MRHERTCVSVKKMKPPMTLTSHMPLSGSRIAAFNVAASAVCTSITSAASRLAEASHADMA